MINRDYNKEYLQHVVNVNAFVYILFTSHMEHTAQICIGFALHSTTDSTQEQDAIVLTSSPTPNHA